MPPLRSGQARPAPVIDVHTHVTPRRFRDAVKDGGRWHTLTGAVGELEIPAFSMPPAERIADMDSLGVDVQVLSPNTGFYQYGLDPQITKAIARDCNRELAEAVHAFPERFTGLATVPMQDPSLAVAEMEHAMSEMGLRGVIINDQINGHTLDEPQFRPFWKAVEERGAVVFFHQGGSTVVEHRTTRYALPNTVGNLVERALTFGTLVFGGVIDRFPDLKICLGHAGGYTAFGIARMDKGWEAAALGLPEFEDARRYLRRPPSDYLDRFYYDSCTHSEATLRFLIDAVGVDQVVMGTDYPAPMILDDVVAWINGLPSLSAGEREAILCTNPGRMMGL
jgi:aminocarboxymuconate-semialdehyde decarboxylase